MYISVNVDDSEVLSELSDEKLIQEIKDRKLRLAAECKIDPFDLAGEALSELRCGRASTALVILERMLNPKWKDAETAEKAYKAAMRRA